jgi:hypothetical protein
VASDLTVVAISPIAALMLRGSPWILWVSLAMSEQGMYLFSLAFFVKRPAFRKL